MRRAARNRLTANLVTALRVADAGMRVFPVVASRTLKGRWKMSPAFFGSSLRSSRSAGRIKGWWDVFPDALPAMLCSEYLVIEAEHYPGGDDGITAMEMLIAEFGDWPFPPVVLTPVGKQYYFQNQEPLISSVNFQLPDGINVLGSGNFVIAPGAILPDGSGWKIDESQPSSIPELPKWLQEKLRNPSY